ncbi:hypothetical protein ATN83_2957 [Raoultella ornithinolytica]|nr:hypothetical protein ATN83_2957 [Raoultella ornithinolytica]KDV93926.1 hypothetical protein AB00_2070 [Raoultella ornithinolytica 2-156-04_S1_C1]KDX14155.1 hypothetical protein AB28_2258 [Raoultella ornithinolytica 2-156-04_S1_C2]
MAGVLYGRLYRQYIIYRVTVLIHQGYCFDLIDVPGTTR